jgi:hypothetical protein
MFTKHAAQRRRFRGSLVLPRQPRLELDARCERRIPVIRLDNSNCVYIKSVDRPIVNEIQLQTGLIPDNVMYQCYQYSKIHIDSP